MSLPVEITGKESPAGDGSALDALIDFYRSFNASDLKALAANWGGWGGSEHGQSDWWYPARMACHQRGLCEVV